MESPANIYRKEVALPRVGFPAGGGQFNRTLLMEYASSTGRDDTCTQRILDLC
jgi:hypothetical protein